MSRSAIRGTLETWCAQLIQSPPIAAGHTAPLGSDRRESQWGAKQVIRDPNDRMLAEATDWRSVRRAGTGGCSERVGAGRKVQAPLSLAIRWDRMSIVGRSWQRALNATLREEMTTLWPLHRRIGTS